MSYLSTPRAVYERDGFCVVFIVFFFVILSPESYKGESRSILPMLHCMSLRCCSAIHMASHHYNFSAMSAACIPHLRLCKLTGQDHNGRTTQTVLSIQTHKAV